MLASLGSAVHCFLVITWSNESMQVFPDLAASYNSSHQSGETCFLFTFWYDNTQFQKCSSELFIELTVSQ